MEFLPIKSIFFWEITSTGESSEWKWLHCSCSSKLNIPRMFSSCEETTNLKYWLPPTISEISVLKCLRRQTQIQCQDLRIYHSLLWKPPSLLHCRRPILLCPCWIITGIKNSWYILFELDAIDKINRFCEVPTSGILCDLLWSDPSEESKADWSFNATRACSYYYSSVHVKNFLKQNKLKTVIRAHEVQLKGFRFHYTDSPMSTNLITVFSAPNYCGKYTNLGAIGVI